MTTTTLHESTPFAVAAVPAEGPGRLRVQIINAGVGSSGAYPAETLEQAAKDGVFSKGCHVYLDHPTESEQFERPGRSVRDLAGALVTDAVYENGALFAEVEVYSPWRTAIAEMADVIGMSIRAAAIVEDGDFEGRRLPIVKKITEAFSVDFVTHAGRGGRVVEVIESARAATRAIERGVSEATANDRREQLSALVKDAHNADGVWVYVRDFDDTTVWFEVSADGGDGSGIFAQGYTTTDDVADALSGTSVEVRIETKYVPVNPAGQSTTQESQEVPMPNIEEARLRQLEADAGRVSTLESERDTVTAERDTARRELAESRARLIARPIVAAVLNAAEALHPVTRQRVIDAVVEAVTVTADGTLDTAAVTTAATEARTNAEAEAAAIAEMHGVGTVRGLGSNPKGGQGDVSEADVNKAIASAFGRKLKEA